MVMHFAVSALETLRAMHRVCPNCEHKQLVPRSEKNAAVRCENCEREIPAKGGE
jgi:ribosomal protein S27E